MVMQISDEDERWKTGFWYWLLVLDVELKNNRMTNGLGYDFNECGRFSISSWLDDVALPQ